MSESDLWDRYQRTRSTAARNELVLYFQHVVAYEARILASRLPQHVEAEELFAMGVVGLIEAVERFNPATGYQFVTFATWRVRGAMLDGLRSLDGASRLQRRRARELGQVADALTQLHQRQVSVDEAAHSIGTRAPALAQTVAMEDLPRDAPIVFGGEERTEVELLVNDETLLNDTERMTLRLSYFGDYSLREIGGILGVTESRVCQIRKTALTKLRAAIERDELRSVRA
jgi:RNA polymerase sigma factor for flagellar operon FliA